MSLEVDDVRAWLIELNQLEAAALLSEAEFEYTYVDTAFRLDAEFDETDILELAIRVPPRIYRGLSDRYKAQSDQIEAAVSELSSHTKGTWIRSTSWLMRLPKIEEVESTPDMTELFSDSGLSDVQRLWTKAKARAAADPAGAITAAKTMLESLCKLLITHSGKAYSSKDDLPSLYSQAVDQFNLAPGKQTEAEYRKVAGSCATIVNAISCIRNRESDSHSSIHNAEQIQAKFVVNIAGTIATFLIGLWNQKRDRKDGGSIS